MATQPPSDFWSWKEFWNYKGSSSLSNKHFFYLLAGICSFVALFAALS